MQTFEEFLIEKHAVDYHGTDDAMVDAFEEWLGVIDSVYIVEFAEEWHNSQEKSVEEIEEVISNFDGNSIIRTGYDEEPSITRSGINQIATAIHTLVYGVNEGKGI